MDKKSRKRHATDSSTDETSVSQKKRKKSSKRDIVQSPILMISSSPSRSTSLTKGKKASAPVIINKTPPLPPEASATAAMKAAKKKKKTLAVIEEAHNEETETTEAPAKPKRKGKAFYHKPVSGSWCNHVGGLVMYRAVSQAIMMEIDPRENEESVNWNMMSGGFITAKDLELIWCLIKQEFSGKSLTAIREELKPYTSITPGDITRACVREQFKMEFPKAPPTPYMLFVKNKTAAIRAKYPDVNQVEIARKLGAKWKALGSEKQEKFKQQYQTLKAEYDVKLEEFYTRHPDAKVPARLRGKAKEDDNLTPEEKRIKELKAFRPKPPDSAYMLFCKAKRAKVHKQHPELSQKQVTSKLSIKWKEMISSQKAKYQQAYEDAKSRYKLQMKVFHETYPDAKELLAKGKKTKSEETSTQTGTSMVSAPGSSAPLVATNDDESTDYDTSEDEEKEGVSQRGTALSRENDASDSESSDVPPNPVAAPLTSTQSHDQSHDESPDTIDSTSDELTDSD